MIEIAKTIIDIYIHWLGVCVAIIGWILLVGTAACLKDFLIKKVKEALWPIKLNKVTG